MTWKVDGKIAMNFPRSGVPNRDTYQIRFAPTGCSEESQILEIEKVYFVPAGATVTQANLSQYLVWHRYWESSSYVPYDNTCSIIITGDDTTQKFTVQVMKDGEDITSSLDHLKGWAYIVKAATREIIDNRVEISRITKSILVIDEAQDMSADEFALVEALIARNEDIRVIAVGDDDQNIYAFRGSDSKHLKQLLTRYGGIKYDMLENFRSGKCIINRCFITN
mgnify:CR=1 FL=1